MERIQSYQLSPGVAFQSVGDGSEGVLLSIESGFLYRCNQTATDVVSAIKNGESLEAIVDRLHSLYGVGRNEIRDDVEETLGQLSNEQLIVARS